MPWYQTEPMNERARFVISCNQQVYSMTELCERFGVSRKTGYKWLDRYERDGLEGLLDRCRAPYSCPHRTPEEIERHILNAFDNARYKRGPRKLRRLLQNEFPDVSWPSKSTFGDIFKRHGLTTSRGRRVKKSHPGAGALVAPAPNAVWTVDYKGQVRINHCYCFPLTILDSASRLLLSCQALTSTSRDEAWPVFKETFRQYGLPDAIRSDNGTPFVSMGWLGLTRLAVWWIKLGIRHQRITPGKPQENPRHERMHRTLKEHTMLPPAKTMEEQQRRFDEFRDDYNNVRPHEALEDEVPASRYTPSNRPMPERLVEPTYPGHFEVRKVNSTGSIRFKGKSVFLSHALAHEHVGLEEIDCEIWNIVFYETSLARYSEQTQRIT